MSPCRLGMVREWKTDAERRAPLVPETVARLVREGDLEVLVEPSPSRVFADAEYAAAGARITSDLSDCDFLLGIKEMGMDRLFAGKPHLFFSHTIKGQAYNMPLLERLLADGCTLLDYELVRDESGKRTIFFGEQAGQAGMVNSLWTLGRRWDAKGVATPLAELRQARTYDSLEEARVALRAAGAAIRQSPPSGGPIVVGLTGSGNVTRGAADVLAELEPVRITAEELLERSSEELARLGPVIEVRLTDEHYARRREGGGAFDKAHYREHPELYVGRFEEFLPHLTMLVTGHFWAPPFPRLVTEEWLRAAHAPGTTEPRLQVIGDVTCDPGGSIASTLRATLPDDPCYVYDPATGTATSGFEGAGLAVMAVDILPTEIARESSLAFDRYLSPWIVDLARADWGRPLDELAIPEPFRRAIIAHRGSLAPEQAHLEAALTRR